MKMTTIRGRIGGIIIIAMAFSAGYLAFHCTRSISKQIYSIIPSHATLERSPSKIHVFYNLFIDSVEDEERVRNIVHEQFQHLNPLLHDVKNVTITSIGHPLSSIPYNQSISVHHLEGSEFLTLHSLWEYCQRYKDSATKVIYLHSKGSFHPHRQNDLLRDFLTSGALSEECASLPESCNVCSSRMSPLPHPHTSGNMWLARCDYIAQLFNPLMTSDHEVFNTNSSCKGWGRYLAEHWVHSHPSVKPCDLYPGKEFTWDYYNVPQGALLEQRELKLAPRFKFEDYIIHSRYCNDEYEIENFVSERKWGYEVLYNMEMDVDWWGWEFLHRSIQ
jgi:hypothetical protein